MGKMYYSEEEATQKLGVSSEKLRDLVQKGNLHAYADGPRTMYKVDEVDALTPSGPGESGEIELTPADTAAQEGITLSEADRPSGPVGKEDTVITEGISIFEDDELEIEAADPMAKTSIAPSVEEAISAEGVGSGSGLLDLTREPDDTSLGAVLEDINVESAVGSSSAVEAVVEEPAYAETEGTVIEAPTVVAAIDPGAGAFSGLVIGCCLVVLVMGAVAVATMLETRPRYVEILQQNMAAFVAAAGVVAIICAVAGYFLGKSAAERATALQRGSRP